MRTTQTLQTRTPLALFNDSRACATALLAAWLDAWPESSVFGDDEQRYSPETILLELRSELGSHLLSQNYQGLMAAVEIVTTDHFTQSLPDFVRLCNILAGDDPGDTFDFATADEIAWAVWERAVLLALVFGDDADVGKYSDEILGYAQHMLSDAGITRIPPTMRHMFATTPAVFDDQNTDLADDPAMWQIANGVQAAQIGEITNALAARHGELRAQLAAFAQTGARRVDDTWAEPAFAIASRLVNAKQPGAA